MFTPVATKILRWLSWLLAVVAAAFVAYAAVTWSRLPSLPEATDVEPEAVASTTAPVPSDSWQAFVRGAGTATRDAGPVAKRFRLAGTFFAYHEGQADTPGNRRAILDDLEKASQYLISEGQDVDGFQVAGIYQDHIILRKGGMDTELWLGFGEGGGAPTGDSGQGRPSPTETVLEKSRFGDRVGTNRWVISRDSLLGYYRELVDDPERIANLYMSLKPQYKDEAIAGYYLEVEGEGEFFKAIGLNPGDVIRKVNSMNMTSQKRAEYFIGEFVKNRVNAFVLDVERGGKPEKLIYMIR